MANLVNSAGVVSLTKDNYETWKMQMEALLTKQDLWQYVSGEKLKPVVPEGADHATKAAMENSIQTWIREDKKAHSDLILNITAAELNQFSDCRTSQELWNKVEAIFALKKPTRKSALVKQLLQRVKEQKTVREHIQKFFDAVDELAAMDININSDVLAIMLLYTLPKGFENFRRAIESRSNLPDMESLKVQILEENNARMQKSGDDSGTNVASCSKTPQKFMSSPNTQALTEVKNKNNLSEPNIKRETKADGLYNGVPVRWAYYLMRQHLNTTKTNSSIRLTPKRLSYGKQKCSCRVTCKNRKCSCRKNEVACNNCDCNPENCSNTDRDVFILKLKRSLSKDERRMK